MYIQIYFFIYNVYIFFNLYIQAKELKLMYIQGIY